jgi:5,10-methenyltetrahydrofolate synthetase
MPIPRPLAAQQQHTDVTGALTTLFTNYSEVTFVNILQHEAQYLPSNYQVAEVRDAFDYTYDVQKLINLSGKKLHGKKNHYNHFINHYNFEYLPMNQELANQAAEVYQEWYQNHPQRDDKSFKHEYKMSREFLLNFDARNVNGGVIKAEAMDTPEENDESNLKEGKKIIAWTISEQISDNAALIHFEKADSAINGAYTAINKLHLQYQYPNLKFVNREDDAGGEGLRRAKMSYRPMLLPKFQGVAKSKIPQLKKDMRDRILSSRAGGAELNVDVDALMNHAKISGAHNIFCYVSMQGEVDTKGIITRLLELDKNVYVPYIAPDSDVKTNNMQAIKISDTSQLVKSNKGFYQPNIDAINTLTNNIPQLDVAIVPGVAFDSMNNRLGYGGGYYDRFFAQYNQAYPNTPIYKIALARPDCIVGFIPTDEFDIKMDEVVI